MSFLPLFAMYAIGLTYLAILSRTETLKNKRRISDELRLQQEKERHLERWRMFLLFMEESRINGESMMEIMWMNKCSEEKSAVDRINEQILNL